MEIYKAIPIFFLIALFACTGFSSASESLLPDLEVSGISAPADMGTGDYLLISVTVKNTGGSTATLSEVRVYLSEDAAVGHDDSCIGKRFLVSIPPGSEKTTSIRFTPSTDFPPGRYYIGAQADATSRVSEADEGNNWYEGLKSLDISSPYTTPYVTFVPGTSPTPTAATPSPTLTIGPQIPTPRPTITLPSWYPTPTPTRTPWIPRPVATPTIFPWVPTPTTTPTSVPWIPTAIPTTPASTAADLVISGFTVPDSAGSGKTFTTGLTVKNQGSAKSGYCEVRVYLSLDAQISRQDTLVGSESVWHLDPGEKKTIAVRTTLPVLDSGDCYWIGAIVDPTDIVAEENEANNVWSAPVMLCVSPPSEPTALEKAVAAAIVKYTNIERQKAGVPQLTVDEELATLAMAHSDDMRDNNFFAHDSPYGYTFAERMRQAGYFTAAENIAATMATYSESADPDIVGQHIVCEQWMESPGHRKNIVKETYRTIGVGVAYEPDRSDIPYGFIATQEFSV
jgi:uncharacterized protein YkwD